MLENTGERIIPDTMKPTNGMLLEHLARYYFASEFVKGRTLDIASGSGYGSQYLAKKNKSIITELVGADRSIEAITYARGRYHHPLVTYECADALDPKLPSKLGQFDSIVSFETLEHVEDDRQFLRNLMKMLKTGGTLIVSTPFGRGRGKPTNEPFHIHQLTEEEFRELLSPYKKVDYYYQRGVIFEPPREGTKYSFGIAIIEKE
ncbi:class I SAM-dependent methyltransferase [Alkalihalobacillus sp. CinArs1]|uniref:class I SAM-dependent methyltransferase n=1 Tax=Alkalihalobacillus sp. CinArs1 TaxID=2995314 RepID=UPI0022DDF2AD|nr:class I SAM-dependent methyltransferase [Alkalihalobacillus sp. CinArs1]